jgi:hypothetical protein
LTWLDDISPASMSRHPDKGLVKLSKIVLFPLYE